MEGARLAVRAAIHLLEADHGLSRREAYLLCSVAGDLKILEIVDAGVWNVGFTLPLSRLPGDERARRAQPGHGRDAGGDGERRRRGRSAPWKQPARRGATEPPPARRARRSAARAGGRGRRGSRRAGPHRVGERREAAWLRLRGDRPVRRHPALLRGRRPHAPGPAAASTSRAGPRGSGASRSASSARSCPGTTPC